MTGPAVARYKTIDPRNAYLARQRLTYYEPAVGQFIAWAGQDDVTVRFSDESTGFTAEGFASTITGLGPFDMSESTAEPGVYYAEIPAASLLTPLLARIGDYVYQIVEGGVGDSGTYALVETLPLLVAQPRYPQ